MFRSVHSIFTSFSMSSRCCRHFYAHSLSIIVWEDSSSSRLSPCKFSWWQYIFSFVTFFLSLPILPRSNNVQRKRPLNVIARSQVHVFTLCSAPAFQFDFSSEFRFPPILFYVYDAEKFVVLRNVYVVLVKVHHLHALKSVLDCKLHISILRPWSRQIIFLEVFFFELTYLVSQSFCLLAS